MKKFLLIFFSAVLLFSLSIGEISALAVENEVCFYVSVNGDDRNAGTLEAPYKTIYRAKEAVKYLNLTGTYPSGGVRIILTEGKYSLDGSLDFSVIDSGKENAPVVYEAQESTKVTICADAEFDIPDNTVSASSAIYSKLPEVAKANVKEIDLSGNFQKIENPLSINSADVAYSDVIVTVDGDMRTLARYPNKGEQNLGVSSITNAGSSSKAQSMIFTVDDSKISSWSGENNIYMEGYTMFLWKYQKVRIDSITDNTLTSEPIKLETEMNSDAQIWFSNIPEELDSPGEYYIDRENLKLYYYPLNADEKKITVSKSNGNLINMTGTRNVKFKNINFEGTQGNGIYADGANNVEVSGCSFKNIGKKGVVIKNSHRSGVDSCNFVHMGTGGVAVNGGRYYDLASGYNYVTNCEMQAVSETISTSSPAIHISGVGNTASYNEIHDMFHTALTFVGNNNIISHNEIYDCLRGTNDAGAIYTYCRSASRRNVIEYNYIHDLGTGTEKFELPGLSGIYLDGSDNGQIIRNNTLYNVPNGVFVNGGGYHDISNNVFADVEAPICSRVGNVDGEFFSDFYQLRKDKSVWLSAYSELGNIPSEANRYTLYVGNSITSNVAYSAKTTEFKLTQGTKTPENKFSDNVIAQNSIFNDYANKDFTINTASSELPQNFKAFVWNDVGPKK